MGRRDSSQGRSGVGSDRNGPGSSGAASGHTAAANVAAPRTAATHQTSLKSHFRISKKAHVTPVLHKAAMIRPSSAATTAETQTTTDGGGDSVATFAAPRGTRAVSAWGRRPSTLPLQLGFDSADTGCGGDDPGCASDASDGCPSVCQVPAPKRPRAAQARSASVVAAHGRRASITSASLVTLGGDSCATGLAALGGSVLLAPSVSLAEGGDDDEGDEAATALPPAADTGAPLLALGPSAAPALLSGRGASMQAVQRARHAPRMPTGAAAAWTGGGAPPTGRRMHSASTAALPPGAAASGARRRSISIGTAGPARSARSGAAPASAAAAASSGAAPSFSFCTPAAAAAAGDDDCSDDALSSMRRACDDGAGAAATAPRPTPQPAAAATAAPAAAPSGIDVARAVSGRSARGPPPPALVLDDPLEGVPWSGPPGERPEYYQSTYEQLLYALNYAPQPPRTGFEDEE